MLCSEAFEIVTPATDTGSSSATGVRIPVRPTDGTMFRTRVCPRCALNLNAIAQRGDRDTSPSRRCMAALFTLATTPSTS